MVKRLFTGRLPSASARPLTKSIQATHPYGVAACVKEQEPNEIYPIRQPVSTYAARVSSAFSKSTRTRVLQ
jgi:hypothetical protein